MTDNFSQPNLPTLSCTFQHKRKLHKLSYLPSHVEYVFEIVDKTGRKIHLTKERWAHITSPTSLHPYMTNYLDEVQHARTHPAAIVSHPLDETKADYYLHLKQEKRYLLVGVKYLNGEGFVTTAFLTRKLLKHQ